MSQRISLGVFTAAAVVLLTIAVVAGTQSTASGFAVSQKKTTSSKPTGSASQRDARQGRSARAKGAESTEVSATAKLAGEWPQWRGPARDGVSSETGLLDKWPESGPPLAWETRGLGKGTSSVSIAGGRIYTLGERGNNEVVLALDQENGQEVWVTPIGPAQTRFSHAEPKSTPTVDGDLLFAVGMNGSIACLDSATGKLRWRKEYESEFGGTMMSSWGYSESPLVDGDRVICTPGGDRAALVALNKSTGQVIWKAVVPQSGGAGYSSIVVAQVGGIRQYITLLGQSAGVVGVAAKDGKFLWKYPRVANGTANIPTPIVRGDLVFCSTGYGAGAALLRLVPEGGGIRVEEKYFINANDFQNHHGGMVLVGNHVYAGSGHNNGIPTCIDLRSGKIVWGKKRGPGAESAAVVCADGHLYFRYQNAVMALIEASPASYKLKGSFRIPNGATPSWSHPVVAGGKLFLRDQDRLLCYDVKAAGSSTTGSGAN
jgi:outer membrane protein assembly factor BamB